MITQHNSGLSCVVRGDNVSSLENAYFTILYTFLHLQLMQLKNWTSGQNEFQKNCNKWENTPRLSGW